MLYLCFAKETIKHCSLFEQKENLTAGIKTEKVLIYMIFCYNGQGKSYSI